jgi:hypothetical protein
MKKFIISSLLATGLAASAFAAVPTSDLVLGFRDDGSAGGTNTTQNLQIDLGAISTFKGQAAGSTVTVTNLLGLGSSSISSVFTGTTWTSNTGLFWGIAGTNGNTTSTRTLWGTSIANSSLLNGAASTIATQVGTNTGQSTGASKISSVYSDQATSVYVRASSDQNSWSTLENTGANAFGFAGFTAIGTAGSFENTTAFGSSSFLASDLYEYVPSALNPKPDAKYLGTFAILTNGNVTFTAAIPEPSTYAVILGAATLGFVMLRRRKQIEV